GDIALFELAAPAPDALEHLVEGLPQLGQLGVGHVGSHGFHVLDVPRGNGPGGRRELLNETCALVGRQRVGSSPRARRTRFPPCRASTMAASAVIPSRSQRGRRRATTVAGMPPTTAIDATDALPVARAKVTHSAARGRARTGSTT